MKMNALLKIDQVKNIFLVFGVLGAIIALVTSAFVSSALIHMERISSRSGALLNRSQRM